MDALTTPGTRSACIAEMERWGLTREEGEAEFDKWLNRVKAEVWDDGAASADFYGPNPYREEN